MKIGLGLGLSSIRGGASSPLLAYPEPTAGSATFQDDTMPDGWTFNKGAFTSMADPVIDDGQYVISFAATDSADPGTTNDAAGTNGARLETASPPAGDFEVYTGWFNNPMLENAGFSGAGFVLQTATSAARIEIYMQADQTQARTFVKYASTTASSGTANIPAPTGMANGSSKGWLPFHKLERVGDVWTFSASYDGVNYSTVTSFTWAVTLTKLSAHCYQLTPGGAETEFRLGYISYDAPYLPTVRDNVTRSVLLSEDWSDLSAWVNDSAGTGASATVSGGVLSLACGTADGSTGRLRSSTIYPENVEVLIPMIQTSAISSDPYVGIGVRGQPLNGQEWAGQYAAPIAQVYEASLGGDTTRLVTTSGPLAVPDGAKWTYQQQYTPPMADLTNLTNIRMQAIGPVVRAKVWDASGAEPDAWDTTIYTHVRGAGRVGMALSHNDGFNTAAGVDVSPMVIYGVS